MTLEQILNQETKSSVDDIKNRFLIKSIKSSIDNRLNNLKTDFSETIERTIMRVADSSIAQTYSSCVSASYSGEISSNKVELSEEDKTSLIKEIQKAVFKQLDEYKGGLDYIFGEAEVKKEEPKPEPKVEVTVQKTEEPVQATVNSGFNMFGY